MSDGPVTVFRSTNEAVYQPLVAAMNNAGIRARAMDTAQAGLRWDVQVISPVEVWVPADDVAAAHLFIAEHFVDHPGGAEAFGWTGPDHRTDRNSGVYRVFYLVASAAMLIAGIAIVASRLATRV